MDMSESGPAAAVKDWLGRFIIPYRICPFAERVHEQQSIRYRVLDDADAEACLLALIAECRILDQLPSIETTLLIFSQALADFDDFLDLTAVAEQLMPQQGYQGVYQLAHFHPGYRFAGCDADDPANYTNRSPYPMWHLLREERLEQALAHYPHPELIPERNIRLCRELGSAKLRRILGLAE